MGFVFFQAEDGIRYLVRSRGLGDVYKRQVSYSLNVTPDLYPVIAIEEKNDSATQKYFYYVGAVSYTHLTLPTSDLV